MDLPTRCLRWLHLICACLLLAAGAPAMAESYRFAVHPVLPAAQIETNFSPMLEHLAEQTGAEYELVLSPNYLPHWQALRRGDNPDFVYDGAHVIGYLVKHMGYIPLAKVDGLVSFSLVVGAESDVLEPIELVGKRIATVAPPSLGAIALSDIFPNPMRQPMVVPVNDWVEAAEALLAGKAVAAMVPTPLLQRYPDLTLVASTEQYPHVALVAAPKVPPLLRSKVVKAMLGLTESEAGQAVLQRVNISQYVEPEPRAYQPHARMLEQLYGVRR